MHLQQVYLRERQLPQSVHQTLWQTNTANTILATKVTHAGGFYFVEMTIDTPHYSFLVKESLDMPAMSDAKVTFVRIWASSLEIVHTCLAPLIREIKGVLYPETVVYSSIGPNKNACGQFHIAPDSIQRLFLM